MSMLFYQTMQSSFLHVQVLVSLLIFIASIIWIAKRMRFSSPSFRNIPGPPSPSFLRGNTHQFMDRHNGAEWLKQIAETYGPLCKITGPYGLQWLHVFDPEALYSIAIKDQDNWEKVTQVMLLGPGLLATEGAQHRKQRKMLTPVFSTAYLRDITSVFYETSYRLRDALIADVGSERKEVDILKWTGRTALELLGQGAFGYSFDPLVEDVSDSFGEAVKSFFASLNRLAAMRAVLGPFVPFCPLWLGRMLVKAIPIERVQRMKQIVDMMYKRSTEIVEEKKVALRKGDEAVVHRVGEGKDIMSILLKANMAASDKEKLSDDELVAQVSTFILAGMDTTSNAICRLLHLLALNPEVQAKLRDEIMEAQAGQEVTYDQLNALPYLDAVCRETLRLHGPARAVSRRPRKDTVLPLHKPIRGTDGSRISEVVVPKGTTVFLNLLACNTNKALWGEDAYEWKPERWLAPLPRAVEEARIPGVYSNLMSFHGGPRSCIGFKYAQLELKVVLSVLLANFKFELGDKPIVWNHAGVAYPTASKESKKPEMPLRISRIHL